MVGCRAPRNADNRKFELFGYELFSIFPSVPDRPSDSRAKSALPFTIYYKIGAVEIPTAASRKLNPPAAITHLSTILLLSFEKLHFRNSPTATMPVDLLHPTAEQDLRTHKLKRLVQAPNSFFMDIKCPGCFQITTVFSHAQTVVMCGNCNIHLCEPTGGKARLTEGCSYRKKVD